MSSSQPASQRTSLYLQMFRQTPEGNHTETLFWMFLLEKKNTDFFPPKTATDPSFKEPGGHS